MRYPHPYLHKPRNAFLSICCAVVIPVHSLCLIFKQHACISFQCYCASLHTCMLMSFTQEFSHDIACRPKSCRDWWEWLQAQRESGSSLSDEVTSQSLNHHYPCYFTKQITNIICVTQCIKWLNKGEYIKGKSIWHLSFLHYNWITASVWLFNSHTWCVSLYLFLYSAFKNGQPIFSICPLTWS